MLPSCRSQSTPLDPDDANAASTPSRTRSNVSAYAPPRMTATGRREMLPVPMVLLGEVGVWPWRMVGIS